MKYENLSENSKNSIIKIYLFHHLTHKSAGNYFMDDSEHQKYLIYHDLISVLDPKWKGTYKLNLEKFNTHVENIFLTTEKLLELI
jgi:hypothetical protein